MVVENFSLNLWLFAEVQQQAHFIGCCLEVVQQLSFMLWNQLLDGFQFNKHTTFNDNVSNLLSNNLVLIIDGNWHLRRNRKTETSQFNHQSVFVNLLQKTI